MRAARQIPALADHLSELVDQVVTFGHLQCAHTDHRGRCATRAFDEPFMLYRWIAAAKVARHWRKIWNAVTTIGDGVAWPIPVEEDAKSAVVRALVCAEDRGNDLLAHCNVLDSVLRDLLQSGTAFLTVDSDVLWDTDPMGRQRADEWDMVFAAHAHLSGRFYTSPAARLIHGLVARAVAGGIVAKTAPVDFVKTMSADVVSDSEFVTSFAPYHRERLKAIHRAAQRGLNDTWLHVGTFPNVSLPQGNRFAMEDHLTGRTGSGRLSYPFTAGFSVLVEPGVEGRPAFMAGPGRTYGTVYVHQQRKGMPGHQLVGREVFSVLENLAAWMGPMDASRVVGPAVLGWLLNGPPTESAGTACFRATGALCLDGASDEMRRRLRGLREKASFSSINDHVWIARFLDLLASEDTNLSALPTELVGALLLNLPLRVATSADGRVLLGAVRDRARAALGGSGGPVDKGYALETAVAIDALLKEPRPSRRMVVVGARQMSDAGIAEHEWDVIALDLLANGDWTVTAIECAIKRSAGKDNDAKERLDLLSKAVHERFSDLAEVKTLLASPSTIGGINYENARRGWTR